MKRMHTTEQAFQQQVLDLADLRGWLSYHTYDSRRSRKGFPDLVLVRAGKPGTAGRLIFAELKSETGGITEEQDAWLERLRSVAFGGLTTEPPRIEVYVWRPHDLVDTIAGVLR